MTRLLTIAIPTYNRARSLERMLRQLFVDVRPYASAIAVLVSDNASTDETSQVLDRCERLVPEGLLFKRHRNPSNIGVSRNIVSLFFAAQSRYFMFLGDDDEINAEYFPRIIEVLSSDAPPSAIVQARWDGERRAPEVGYVDWKQAAQLFYEYGNAWAGIVDAQAAVRAIASRRLREEVESIVWPQTVMGYLAMFDQRDRKVFLTDEPIGNRLPVESGGYNICNKAYWNRGLYGILYAASCVDDAIQDDLFRRSLLDYKTPGFRDQLRAILIYALIEKGGERTSDIRSLLRRRFGVTGLMWSVVLKVSDSYWLLYPVSLLAYQFNRRRKVESFDSLLTRLRVQHFRSIEAKEDEERRFGDWF